MKKLLKRSLTWVRPLSGQRVVGLALCVFIVAIAGAALPQAVESVREVVHPSFGALLETRDALDASYRDMLSFTAPFGLNRGNYINFNGLMARLLGQRYMNGVVKLDNGHLCELEPRRDSARASLQITELYQHHAAAAKTFLFVLAPMQLPKYEQVMPAGYESYANENADQLVASLRENGVPVLDLRDELHGAGIGNAEAFFATDRHWKPETGFWANAIILDKLNEMGAIPEVESQYTELSAFDMRMLAKWQLGSSGKRTGRYYVEPDDFAIITPRFDTHIVADIPSIGVHREGAFSSSVLEWDRVGRRSFFEEDAYTLYGRYPARASYRNAGAPLRQKVLWLGDSFTEVVVPFSTLVFGSVDDADMRGWSEEDFSAYYDECQPDIVLLLINPTSVMTKNTTYDFFPDEEASLQPLQPGARE